MACSLLVRTASLALPHPALTTPVLSGARPNRRVEYVHLGGTNHGPERHPVRRRRLLGQAHFRACCARLARLPCLMLIVDACPAS